MKQNTITLIAGIAAVLACIAQPALAKDAPSCIKIEKKWHDSSGHHVQYKNDCGVTKYIQPAWKRAPDGKCRTVVAGATQSEHHAAGPFDIGKFQKLKDCGG